MVRSLGFPGVRTHAFAETAALYRDVPGLGPILERPGAGNHDRGPDGNVDEIIGPDGSAT